MWNSFDTADYSGMIAETITIKGHDGRPVRAYFQDLSVKNLSPASF